MSPDSRVLSEVKVFGFVSQNRSLFLLFLLLLLQFVDFYPIPSIVEYPLHPNE